jgi:hypothetical protein
MCGHFTRSGHMAGNCPSMSFLRRDRHNNPLELLLIHLEQTNGGRWETIIANVGRKTPLPYSLLRPSTNPSHTPNYYAPITIIYAYSTSGRG